MCVLHTCFLNTTYYNATSLLTYSHNNYTNDIFNLYPSNADDGGESSILH